MTLGYNISLKIRMRLRNPSGPSRNIRHNSRIRNSMIKSVRNILSIFIKIMMKLNNGLSRTEEEEAGSRKTDERGGMLGKGIKSGAISLAFKEKGKTLS